MEYLFAFQFWYCELCVKNRWGGGRKPCFVNFWFWRCFNCGVVECGRKHYLGPADIASFSSRSFSRSNKHYTFWHVVSIGYFYEPLLIQLFVPWKSIKFRPSLVYYHFDSQQHVDNHFYKYILFVSNIIQYEMFLLKCI